MYHSLYFIDDNVIKNTWADWHLIPTTRPVLPQPSPTFTYVDIPGADGSMDLTDYLIGRPTFSDRSGSFEFYVDHRVSLDWATVRASLAEFFNGKVMKMYLEDDPNYYYIGRFFFRGWTPDQSYSRVTIEYRVKPYRYLRSNDQEAGL